MCGICGVVGSSKRGAVEAMIEAQRHRGPNDQGVFADDYLALGMCRLSILDLSAAGHQPMSNPARSIWLVYNGELYNYKQERKLLEAKGYRFSSNTDTEVVLSMYEHYGDNFLTRMRGMFALAIYDLRRGPGRRKLLLARDQLGIKPLLYAHTPAGLVFASEMKALLASRMVKAAVDPEGLRRLLTFGSVYQPDTLVQGARMLPAAHRLVIENGETRLQRYWSIGTNRHRGARRASYEELVHEVAETLEESLQLHLVSDVPVGAFLSGGVDSNYLVALMARAIGRRVKTFSVGFEEEGASLDETRLAEKSAAFLGTDHTRVVVRGQEVRDEIDHIARALDQPSVDGVNSYFVSRAAARHVTVALSGTGGDEVFAGYPWFAEMDLFARQSDGPSGPMGKRLLAAIHRFFGQSSLRAEFLDRYFRCYHLFPADEARGLMATDYRPAHNGRIGLPDDLAPTDELPHTHPIDRVTALCLRGYTCNQLLRDIDAVSMAHSLEVRVPFLDVPLLDLALSLPTAARLGQVPDIETAYRGSYRDTGAKRVLIDAGRKSGMLPKDIDRQAKRGFGMPFDKWLRGPLRDILEECLSTRSIARRGLLDTQNVAVLRDQFFQGQRPWNQIWLLMLLEVWCRAVLDQPAFSVRMAA